MGNATNIALGLAIQDTCKTAPQPYLLYLVTGTFLALMPTEFVVHCSSSTPGYENIRDQASGDRSKTERQYHQALLG